MTRRAFSLIEVLIAVLVLALGLLGLGAVFPVVITQQRDAVDRTLGSTAASSIEHTLRLETEFADWSLLRRDSLFGTSFSFDPCNPPTGRIPNDYLWEVEWQWPEAGASVNSLNTYEQDGIITLGGGFAPDCPDPSIFLMPEEIPVASRLVPAPNTGRDPQYVWDFVPRREPENGEIQIALFFRRIDPNIRKPAGNTLADVLTGTNGVSAGEQRYAVAVDADGIPTGDGRGDQYAVPIGVTVEIDPDELDRIPLFGIDGPIKRLMRQRDQLLVDNLGIVRRVVEVDPDDEDKLIISPPFERIQAGPVDTSDDSREENDRRSKVQQLIFTPQIPIDVRIFEVGT